jgi:hypothetical protein
MRDKQVEDEHETNQSGGFHASHAMLAQAIRKIVRWEAYGPMRGELGAVGGVSDIVLSKPSDRPRLIRERMACTACVCSPLDFGGAAVAWGLAQGVEVPLS